MTENNEANKQLPCDHYEYEYKSNCNIFGRFKRFLHADESIDFDCDQLKDLFYSCVKYRDDPSRNLECFLKLKPYENNLIKKRIESIKQNNVWQLRKVAPSDWNAPLPDWCQERIKNSYWYKNKSN